MALLTLPLLTASLYLANQVNAVELSICENLQEPLSPWKKIRSMFCLARRQGSTMGGSRLCLISPFRSKYSYLIWHQQPWFIWQGQVKNLKVIDVETQELSWNYPVKQQRTLLYNGSTLQTGKEYEYRIDYEEVGMGGSTELKTMIGHFKVMGKEEQQKINELLKAKNLVYSRESLSAAEREEKAIKRAMFFSEQGLFAEVARELYSLPDPSPKLKKDIEQIEADFCQ
jgi:hypothetical protein